MAIYFYAFSLLFAITSFVDPSHLPISLLFALLGIFADKRAGGHF